MENQEFDLETDKIYTASIEWKNEESESSPGRHVIHINGQIIPLEDFGKHLIRFEGWKIDLKLHE